MNLLFYSFVTIFITGRKSTTQHSFITIWNTVHWLFLTVETVSQCSESWLISRHDETAGAAHCLYFPPLPLPRRLPGGGRDQQSLHLPKRCLLWGLRTEVWPGKQISLLPGHQVRTASRSEHSHWSRLSPHYSVSYIISDCNKMSGS